MRIDKNSQIIMIAMYMKSDYSRPREIASMIKRNFDKSIASLKQFNF